jgi:hypothetical protein
VLQLVALQELQPAPSELVNPLSLLWLTLESSRLTFLPLHVGQATFSLPKTRTSKSFSHVLQWYSKIGIFLLLLKVFPIICDKRSKYQLPAGMTITE